MMWRARQYEQESWFQLTTIVAVGLTCWLATESSVVLAKPPSANGYHRPCTASDIVGTWEVTKWRALVTFDEKDKNSPYFHPHQLYQFTEDGALKSMTSTKAFHGDSSDTFGRIPKVISYRFSSNGRLEATRTDLPGHKELWICHFVTTHVKDASRQVDLRKGDVVMTLLDRQGAPLYIRQLRRHGNESGQ